MDIFTLNCWVRSQDARGIFQVKILKTETFAALQEAIKNKNPATFHDVDARALPLYKPRDPLPRPYGENLSKFVLSEHGEPLEMGDDELSELFPDAPQAPHPYHNAPSTIVCWLRGDTLDASVELSIRPGASERTSQLIHHVKDAQPNLRNVADNHIRLYRISGDEDQLQENLNRRGDSELLRGDTLLAHFLGVPVLDRLCVCAEVLSDPDLPHGEKRHHSPSSDLEKMKRKKIASDIAEFHSKIWGKGPHAHATVFVTTPVDCDRSTGVEVPSQCCIMKSPSYGGGSVRLSGTFIRNEFVLAVENIVAFYKGKNFTDGSKENDDEADTTMEGDDGVGATTETPVNATEAGVTQTQFPIDIANPFLAPDFPLEGKKRGIIVTGAPGIGKSLLLEFILHLRNLAGLPTLFVRDNERVDLFTSDGVFRIKGSQIVKSELLSSIWALVDSNTDLVGVPEWVRSLGCFIVQAASLRRDRLQWRKKEVGVSMYIMKMWSFEEALAARMLQGIGSAPSETQLQTFFKRYAPSARTAYSFASCIQDFERDLREDVGRLSLHDVVKAVDDMSALRADDGLPHRLFIIQPRKTRTSFILKFASQHVLEILITALDKKVSNAAQELFQVYNRNSENKVVAGQLLDAVIRGDFTRGATWPIRQMEISPMQGSVNQHWKILPSKRYPTQYLIVGDPTQPIVRICDERPDNDPVYAALSCFSFLATTKEVTKTGYYIPTAKNEATFGAFYYDADHNEATVLQATVSTRHAIKVKGLRRLRDVGVKSVRYVAVTGPLDSEEFDLPVPIAYDGVFVKEKYHLQL